MSRGCQASRGLGPGCSRQRKQDLCGPGVRNECEVSEWQKGQCNLREVNKVREVSESRASSLDGFQQGSQGIWFALWLQDSPVLEGRKRGISPRAQVRNGGGWAQGDDSGEGEKGSDLRSVLD